MTHNFLKNVLSLVCAGAMVLLLSISFENLLVEVVFATVCIAVTVLSGAKLGELLADEADEPENII